MSLIAIASSSSLRTASGDVGNVHGRLAPLDRTKVVWPLILLLPDRHPTEGAFPTTYILKDLSYAIALAESAGLTLEQASATQRLMERTAAAGYRDHYYTAVIKAIEKR